ncbi:hypothetical protein KR50_13350 [Jeotgalibacillus campisalis]|uniref:Uncharacterized protein n=1 Tax=Jeotgalibacillus campisalis TaxID=220754 RepID=A0A0C2VI86_9BACL|nr:hypothetical protein KR50_13350 [Jeotgalibacillus campisalis]
MLIARRGSSALCRNLRLEWQALSASLLDFLFKGKFFGRLYLLEKDR